MNKKTGCFVKLKILAEVCSGNSGYVMKKPPFEIKEFVRQKVAEKQLLEWLVNNGIVNPYRGTFVLSMMDIKRFGLTDTVVPEIKMKNGNISEIIYNVEKVEKNATNSEHADTRHS